MAERETAKACVVRYSPGAKRLTVGADKGFDTAGIVADMRDFNVTTHGRWIFVVQVRAG